MSKRNSLLVVAAVALLVAAFVAGCGSSSDSGHDNMNDSMPGMSHDGGSTGMSGMHDGDMQGHGSGMSMNGTMPMVAGADGTSPRAGNLFLSASPSSFEPGKPQQLELTVTNISTGKPVTKFEVDQTKLMHLIVVNHDFSGFQHLHPTLQKNGKFVTPLRLPRAGIYQAIADFTTNDKRYALGLDLGASGKAELEKLPPPSTTASVDGYKVTIDHGKLASGEDASIAFQVTRGDKPVTDLQPYLGAYGHLVALHKPDMAYAHVHPTKNDSKTGTVTFNADFATSGTYRLYFEFKSGGATHVAPFTVVVE